MIKAIETEYNGCLFRSRLEARWAVFFDALGVEYQYELEGFDLGEAGWYLPDFYIPDWDTWVEIKPKPLSSEEGTKCFALARNSDKRVIALCGDVYPFKHKAMIFKPSSLLFEGEPAIKGPGKASFGQCRKCDAEIWLEIEDYGAWCLKPHCSHNDRWPLIGELSSMAMKAYKAARQARFEHKNG